MRGISRSSKSSADTHSGGACFLQRAEERLRIPAADRVVPLIAGVVCPASSRAGPGAPLPTPGRSGDGAGAPYRSSGPAHHCGAVGARAFRRAPAVRADRHRNILVVLLSWLMVNWTYQVIKQADGAVLPGQRHVVQDAGPETWDEYAPIFRAHATNTITPEFLAALAQVEGSGNPIARTYWRWSLSMDPLDVYRPASSAVGMYQFTDGTFDEARRYCIHDHHVVEDGAWNAWRSCWFNALYSRVVPSHAVEMAAAYLDVNVTRIAATTPRRCGDRAAAPERGGADAPVRGRRGKRVRWARLPPRAGSTLRRSPGSDLRRTCERGESGVRAARGAR